MGRLNPFWKREHKIDGVDRNDDEEASQKQEDGIPQRARQAELAKQ
jgi:hypothetical protein